MNSIIETIQAAMMHADIVRPKVGGFPYLAEALRQAGVKRYHFDVPSRAVIYTTENQAVLQPGDQLRSDMTEITAFNEPALIDAIRADQRGESTFDEFVEASFQAGIVRFEVDTDARTCSYFGAFGESYVEHYPSIELPPVAV